MKPSSGSQSPSESISCRTGINQTAADAALFPIPECDCDCDMDSDTDRHSNTGVNVAAAGR
jgi:hypothetical protein